MTHRTACDVEVVDLTPDEAAAAFDELARREMGISGTEFLQRWSNGEWDGADLDSVPGLVDVAMALPLVR